MSFCDEGYFISLNCLSKKVFESRSVLRSCIIYLCASHTAVFSCSQCLSYKITGSFKDRSVHLFIFTLLYMAGIQQPLIEWNLWISELCKDNQFGSGYIKIKTHKTADFLKVKISSKATDLELHNTHACVSTDRWVVYTHVYTLQNRKKKWEVQRFGMWFSFPGGSDGQESACNVGDPGLTLGWEDPLQKGKATHSSILAWRIIPWTEKPGSATEQLTLSLCFSVDVCIQWVFYTSEWGEAVWRPGWRIFSFLGFSPPFGSHLGKGGIH